MFDKRQLVNTFWQLTDKVFKLLVGFFVNIAVARFLGPAEFGVFNLYLTINMFLMLIVTLGMDKIILSRFSGDEATEASFSTYFGITLMGGLVSVALALAVGLAFSIGPELLLLLTVIVVSNLFQPFAVVDYYFQGKSDSRPVVIVRLMSFALSNGLKVVALFLEAPLVVFAALFSLEVVISGIAFYFLARQKTFHLLRCFQWAIAKQLLLDSWPLFLLGAITLTYMRVDQVIISSLLNSESLGLYSAAVRLSELWYFVPVTLANAYFPYFIRLFREQHGEFEKRLLQFLTIVTYGGLIVSVATILFKHTILELTYGPRFEAAQDALVFSIWALVFVGQGVAVNVYYIAHGLQAKNLVLSAMACVFSIITNLLLVPLLGFVGSALTLLLVQAVFTLLVPLFIRDMRHPTYLLWRSFNPRYLVGGQTRQ